MNDLDINLQEWQVYSPDPGTDLEGVSLGENTSARSLAEELTESGKLVILELIKGLSIQTTSYVGSVNLGPIHIKVHPKITGMPLLNLLRYAYRLRNLTLLPQTIYGTGAQTFQDLLIHQLVAEVTELISRGVQREYLRTKQPLTRPRGRIDFQTYLRKAGTTTSSLPCIHHPRLENSLINQIMLSGLYLGVSQTEDLLLKAQLRRLIQLLELSVTPARLEWEIFERAKSKLDRRTAAYRPVFSIIEILMKSEGITFDGRHTDLALPGFLFDMNRFFQALILRFLQENMEGYKLQDEYTLKGTMAYIPGHNPRNRRSPEPRPDYAVLKNSNVVALLDAKYRDLWEKKLPREMLYQLSMYALSQKICGTAVILYPTTLDVARESKIAIYDPVYRNQKAQVILRPVNLLYFEKMITSPRGFQNHREKQKYARYMAFGRNDG